MLVKTIAKVAELVDALDLGSSGATRESSSLSFRTIYCKMVIVIIFFIFPYYQSYFYRKKQHLFFMVFYTIIIRYNCLI